MDGVAADPDAAPALDALLPEAYADLRQIARRHLRRMRAGATLNTTAVVHEAYLKLASSPGSRWNDRNHFLALASMAMRQLIVDHARRRAAGKRGGAALRVTLEDGIAAPAPPDGVDVLALDAALARLAALDPLLERLVECRFFAGLSLDETAQALGRSTRSVERDWARARAYLFQALSA
jgi:RNA polymerase sigma factor (TIGR02999 family)